MRRFDTTDYRRLSLGEQMRRIEVDGYVVLPDLLTPDQVAALKAETAFLPTKAVDYSEYQRNCPNVQFRGGRITDLIANPPAIAFLKAMFGDDVVMMTYSYARSEPGHPGISLHADGQPYGSRIFGYEGSCPWLIRVLYYLDDLTEDVSPFRVVPRSQLSMHADANPYKRYQEHPEELAVTAKAGSAVLINHRVFHGNYPNTGDRPRELLAIAYRPAWAGPIEKVDEWSEADLERVPPAVRAVMGSRNQRLWEFEGGNKPTNMAREAPGMNPSRWER